MYSFDILVFFICDECELVLLFRDNSRPFITDVRCRIVRMPSEIDHAMPKGNKTVLLHKSDETQSTPSMKLSLNK